MDIKLVQQLAAYKYYYPILERYALQRVKNKTVAGRLANETLLAVAGTNGLDMQPSLRKALHQEIKLQCFYWQQVQVFDRPAVKVETIFSLKTTNNK